RIEDIRQQKKGSKPLERAPREDIFWSFSRSESAAMVSALFGPSVHAICTERRSGTMKTKKQRLKKLPVLRTDEAAEHFVATADLSEYDLSGMVPVRFEFKPKTERVNMRLSKGLLDSVKARAAREGVSYQRFI